jgi:hypothetical protein
LPKIIEFYNTYSKIFPNYIALREAKYIYRNIRKKQKIIDSQLRKQDGDIEIDEADEAGSIRVESIFNTRLHNSILKYQPSLTDISLDDFKVLQESAMSFMDLVNILELNYNPLVTIERGSFQVATPRKETKKKPTKSRIRKEGDCKKSPVKATLIEGSKDTTLMATGFSSRSSNNKKQTHKVTPSLPDFDQRKLIETITPILNGNSGISGNTHICINNNFFGYDPPSVKTKRMDSNDGKTNRFGPKTHRYHTIIEKIDWLSPTGTRSSQSKSKTIKQVDTNKLLRQQTVSPFLTKVKSPDPTPSTTKSTQQKVIYSY